MAKLQFLLRPEGEDIEAFGARVRSELVPALLAREPAALKATFTEVRPPPVSVIPFQRRPVALFSIGTEDDGDRGSGGDAGAWADVIDPGGAGQVAGYRVDESVPVRAPRDWADGQTTPGLGLLTVFRRKPGLDDATFLDRWHGGHTPLSLEIHPLFGYVRNVVRTPVVEGSPELDAIVEEQFGKAADLLDPTKFFGGPYRMVPNMIRVAVDIAGFIDLRSMRTWLVSELHARSPDAPPG